MDVSEERMDELIKRYDIYLRSDGMLASPRGKTIPADVMADLRAMKPQMVSYIRAKQEKERKERKARMEQEEEEFFSGTARISVVRTVKHLWADEPLEYERNVVVGSFFLYRLFPGKNIEDYETKLAPGEYKVSDLPQWAAWKQEEIKSREKREYIKNSKKTYVQLNRCWECGVMTITGGSNGKLPYDTYKQAQKQLSDFRAKVFSSIQKNALLNEAPKISGMVETEDFIFEVTSTNYDGC
jgi:hypothetical protein